LHFAVEWASSLAPFAHVLSSAAPPRDTSVDPTIAKNVTTKIDNLEICMILSYVSANDGARLPAGPVAR
jgi:hypothetical protein